MPISTERARPHATLQLGYCIICAIRHEVGAINVKFPKFFLRDEQFDPETAFNAIQEDAKTQRDITSEPELRSIGGSLRQQV